MSRGSTVPVSQQPLQDGLKGRGLVDLTDTELPADQEDLFGTIEDDSPQRPERQFRCEQILRICHTGQIQASLHGVQRSEPRSI